MLSKLKSTVKGLAASGKSSAEKVLRTRKEHALHRELGGLAYRRYQGESIEDAEFDRVYASLSELTEAGEDDAPSE